MYIHHCCGLTSHYIHAQRGWTTWTTGIVDKRVIGMVPIVEDLLNIQKVCIWHCGWLSQCSVVTTLACWDNCTCLHAYFRTCIITFALSVVGRLPLTITSLSISPPTLTIQRCWTWSKLSIPTVSSYKRAMMVYNIIYTNILVHVQSISIKEPWHKNSW